jgi:addiction module HigA family antidote
MGTYIKDTTCKKSQPSPVGIRLKAELKKRGFSQKSFAEQLGMSPSHLSDIVRGNRPLSLKTAVILQNLLGIPAKDWMDLQISHKLEGNSDNNSEGFRDAEEIAAYDQIICVKTLLKKANISAKGNRECLDVLRYIYGSSEKWSDR